MPKKSIIIFTLVIFLSAGCATTPRKDALSVYNIRNTSYLPLLDLCESRGIDWDYDQFAKTVVLTRDGHRINLMINNDMALVDGRSVHLRAPVDIYQGRVVVPYRFKEQVLDSLFKEYKTPPKLVLPLSKIKKVIIDPGHGGKDPGAIGRSGIKEKTITLDIANRLSKVLRSSGVEVAMTRSSDKFVSLPQRVAITNKSGAELFLSIHANANRVRKLYGFEVYYVSGSVSDCQRALSAARQASPVIERQCLSPSLNLKAILWDMFYTHSRAESIELGRSICKKVDRNLDTRVIGVKDARFYVLKGARMPAVLIETGFVSNRKEERMLSNAYYRQKIAESIAEGLTNYGQDIALAEVNLK